ncbi:MAG: 4a-hydroxytetrahydrobiopterin dehydratase [Anaerolineae bacterium]
MSKLLSSEAIEAALAATPGWTRANNAITRTFTLPSFTAALTFAAAVGHLAERANHHPDILIQYRQVTLTLSTHDAGGLTDKDFKLAGEINALAA